MKKGETRGEEKRERDFRKKKGLALLRISSTPPIIGAAHIQNGGYSEGRKCVQVYQLLRLCRVLGSVSDADYSSLSEEANVLRAQLTYFS